MFLKLKKKDKMPVYAKPTQALYAEQGQAVDPEGELRLIFYFE